MGFQPYPQLSVHSSSYFSFTFCRWVTQFLIVSHSTFFLLSESNFKPLGNSSISNKYNIIKNNKLTCIVLMHLTAQNKQALLQSRRRHYTFDARHPSTPTTLGGTHYGRPGSNPGWLTQRESPGYFPKQRYPVFHWICISESKNYVMNISKQHLSLFWAVNVIANRLIWLKLWSF